jgi:hypothetical protein
MPGHTHAYKDALDDIHCHHVKNIRGQEENVPCLLTITLQGNLKKQKLGLPGRSPLPIKRTGIFQGWLCAPAYKHQDYQ